MRWSQYSSPSTLAEQYQSWSPNLERSILRAWTGHSGAMRAEAARTLAAAVAAGLAGGGGVGGGVWRGAEAARTLAAAVAAGSPAAIGLVGEFGGGRCQPTTGGEGVAATGLIGVGTGAAGMATCLGTLKPA